MVSSTNHNKQHCYILCPGLLIIETQKIEKAHALNIAHAIAYSNRNVVIY